MYETRIISGPMAKWREEAARERRVVEAARETAIILATEVSPAGAPSARPEADTVDQLGNSGYNAAELPKTVAD